ncbi:MAG: hypothetical protein IPF58_15425 [Saprospirales bacterium]|nr:hypothetical protein [Saprospirales bacterium]
MLPIIFSLKLGGKGKKKKLKKRGGMEVGEEKGKKKNIKIKKKKKNIKEIEIGTKSITEF